MIEHYEVEDGCRLIRIDRSFALYQFYWIEG